MAESLVSSVLDKLISIISQQAARKLKLFSGVEEEVKTLEGNLRNIKAVLEDAEKIQVKDFAVKRWLDKLKDVSYDIDDVLDEWNTAILKRQIQQEYPPPKKARFSVSTLIPSFLLPWSRQLDKRHETAAKVKELNKRLADINNERSRYNFTTERPTLDERRELITSLLDERNTAIPKRQIQNALSWFLVVTNFILEIPSAVFEQLSSNNHPYYALIVMLLSFITFIACIIEFIYKAKRERVTLPLFSSPHTSKSVCTLWEIIGFACSFTQCILTAINYSFVYRHIDPPIKISALPTIFALGFVCSKYMEKPNQQEEI